MSVGRGLTASTASHQLTGVSTQCTVPSEYLLLMTQVFTIIFCEDDSFEDGIFKLEFECAEFSCAD